MLIHRLFAFDVDEYWYDEVTNLVKRKILQVINDIGSSTCID